MKKIVTVLLLGLAAASFSSALSDAAASMAAGSWRELQTTNIGVLYQYQHNGHSLMYSDDITYDPTVEKFYYCGSDHCEPAQFFSFDEASNTWSILPKPSWMPTWCEGVMHGYDHGAIDQANGVYYHRPFGSKTVYRYPSASRTWTALPALPSQYDVGNCCEALEYFPELNGLVWVRDGGRALLHSNNQWTQLGSGLTLSGTYFFAEYNPVEKVLIFWSSGGGKLYKLDRNRQITQITAPPVSMYDGSGTPGALTVDPVSGLYLFFSPTQRQFYTYDVKTDRWQLQSGTRPNITGQGVITTPVAKYGVVFMTACAYASCKVYLYKPPTTAAQAFPAALERSAIKASPNPFRRAVTVEARGASAIYNLDGRKVFSTNKSRFVWNADRLPAGVYLLKSGINGKIMTQKLVLMK